VSDSKHELASIHIFELRFNSLRSVSEIVMTIESEYKCCVTEFDNEIIFSGEVNDIEPGIIEDPFTVSEKDNVILPKFKSRSKETNVGGVLS
jgi:hypothetical protein